MTLPDKNCDSLHDEAERLRSALIAGCGIELTDKERIGLIRRLLALKISVPLFVVIVAAIVTPHGAHQAIRKPASVFR